MYISPSPELDVMYIQGNQWLIIIYCLMEAFNKFHKSHNLEARGPDRGQIICFLPALSALHLSPRHLKHCIILPLPSGQLQIYPNLCISNAFSLASLNENPK